MRVLLTGGFGAVGLAVTRALGAMGIDTVVFERPTPRGRRLARRLPHHQGVFWGDLRDRDAVAAAMADVDVVLHLAFVIHPLTEADPHMAEAVNLDGTRHLLEAATARPRPPRFIFCSSYHVHPFVPDRGRPLRVDDPVAETDLYAAHKIAAEAMVRDAALPWSILRLSSVMTDRRLDGPTLRLMFDIPLHTRFEIMHLDDVGLAFARAATTPAIDGRTLFIGGGAACQTTYRVFYERLFAAIGLPPLPEDAFATGPEFIGDWLDTANSEALLGYQRHGLDDLIDRMRTRGFSRGMTRAVGPLFWRWMVGHSPHRAG